MTQQTTSAGPLELAFVEDFIRQYEQAWSSEDPERVLALMAPDIVYDDPAWPTTMCGHSEVRGFLQSLYRAVDIEDYQAVDRPLLHPDEPKASFYWRGVVTHTGPLEPQGLAATGKRVDLEGGDFLEFRDGKLVRLQVVFDAVPMMRQLGALPQAGSRSERVGTVLFNLGLKLRRRR